MIRIDQGRVAVETIINGARRAQASPAVCDDDWFHEVIIVQPAIRGWHITGLDADRNDMFTNQYSADGPEIMWFHGNGSAREEN